MKIMFDILENEEHLSFIFTKSGNKVMCSVQKLTGSPFLTKYNNDANNNNRNNNYNNIQRINQILIFY